VLAYFLIALTSHYRTGLLPNYLVFGYMFLILLQLLVYLLLLHSKLNEFPVNMTCHSKSQFVEFSEKHFKEEFIEDVRRDILGLVNLHEAILKAKALKEVDNKLFKIKAHRLAINTYDKSLQHLCVFVPKNVDDANVMEEFGMFINLNLVAC